jgi:hypothetical protein
MVEPRQVIAVIQNIPINSRDMRFLISLANNAYSYSALTEKQENAFMQVVNANRETLKEKGVIA